MLAMRLQRTGRSGHAQFRVVVQDSRYNPKSGWVVAYLGSYNPHTKEAILAGEKITQYLNNGAQPSDRVVRLLQKEGLKLPKRITLSAPKKRDVRNPDKRRSTRPADIEPKVEETKAEESAPEATNDETTSKAQEDEPDTTTPPAEETTT